MPPEPISDETHNFFTGTSEMHARISAFDWSETPVGPINLWPPSLKSLIRVLLASQYPMLLVWGPNYTQFYNDAHSRLIGDKHPAALGRDLRITVRESWDTVGPMVEQVLRTGVANWTPALQIVMERHGYREESYFSVSHSPAEDDAGRVMGMLGVCSDVTQQVLGERRLRLLRDLAAQGNELPQEEELGIKAACSRLAHILHDNPLDVPFALFYQRLENRLVLCASVGWSFPGAETIFLDEEESAAPNESHASSSLTRLTMLARRAMHGESTQWEHLDRDFTIPGGPWREGVCEARVMPIAVAGQPPLGILVAGISPNRRLDENYLSFYDLLLRQVAVVVSNAQTYEAEHQRAAALAQLDQAKTQFIDNVSHEFRTPLTLMLGPLEALLERAEGSLTSQEREDVELVHRNSVRLLKLVNTLLSFSRIETQRAEAEFTPTDLSFYTTELASVFGSATERAGLNLIVDCPPLPEPIYIDRDMWEKVVLNLLSNAFKFTFEGEIRVALRWISTGAVLTVSDTGTGIPPDEIPHLFERFHRVRGARSRAQEGTGIGLALVQELVRLQHGRIGVQSELGVGSTFTITLPRGFAHLPPDQVEFAAPEKLSPPFLAPSGNFSPEEPLQWQLERSTSEEKHSLETVGKSTVASPGKIAPAHILVVDDNTEMRGYLGRLLHEYEVELAPDGQQALEAARAHRPDLIITDLLMPESDGAELVRVLRSDSQLRDVPIIILSARAGEEARVEGLEGGADDYVYKPFRAKELLAKVEANLRTNQLRREATNRQMAAILERITDAFYALDTQWRFVYVNQKCEQYLNRERDYLLGKVVWDVFPNMRGSDFFRQYHHAMKTQETVHVEAYSALVGRWLSAHAYPSAEGLTVYFRDITARRQAELERERLLQEAQEANRVKDEFLAIVSHELRTPLNAIMGWAHLIGTGNLNQDDTKRGLESIERNAKAQAQIVEDILDVSRIVTGKMQLKSAPMPLDTTLNTVIDTVRPAVNVKQIQLHTQLEGGVGLVMGDPARLQQIFWNLLSNAIKFTPQGGEVSVSLHRVEENAVVEIKDSGVGIDSAFIPHVFDRFRQADMSSTRIHGGLGLGLAIVRQLVELHHGHIRAQSLGKGHGATFTVELPLMHPQQNSQEANHPIPLDAVVMADAGLPIAPQPRPRPLDKIRLLIVDDQDDTRQLLAFMLMRAGAEVREANSAVSALSVWEEFSPQILVSDIGMPDYDGYWLIAQIRSREALQESPRIPAIALTAYTQHSDRKRALSAGFERHLAKPTNPTELISTIKELVG